MPDTVQFVPDTVEPVSFVPDSAPPPAPSPEVAETARRMQATLHAVHSGTSSQIEQLGQDVVGGIQDLGEAGMGALKGLGSSFNSLANSVNLTAGSVPVIADAVAGLVKGKPVTAAQDWWFKRFVAPTEETAQALAPSDKREFSEKAGHAIGQTLGMISQIVLTGGGALPAQSAATTTGQLTAAALKNATRAMAVPAVSDAVQTGKEVYEQTGDATAAIKAAHAKYLTTTLSGLIPLSAEGSLGVRAVTGAASGVASGEANRQIMNLALPRKMGTPYSNQDVAINAATGAILGSIMGPRAAPEAEAISSADEGKPSEPSALTGPTGDTGGPSEAAPGEPGQNPVQPPSSGGVTEESHATDVPEPAKPTAETVRFEPDEEVVPKNTPPSVDELTALRSVDAKEKLSDEQISQLESNKLAIRNDQNVVRLLPAGRRRLRELESEQEDLKTLPGQIKRDEQMKSDLLAMKDEAGWAETGGKLLRHPETDEVIGRSAWVPRAEWWRDRPKGLNEDQVRAAVDKAVAGQKLTSRETDMIQFMTDVAKERRQNQDYLPTPEDLPTEYQGGADQVDDAHESAMVARAADLDEGVVESLAKQHEDDRDAFLSGVREFLREHDNQATAADRQANQPAARQEEAVAPEPQTGQEVSAGQAAIARTELFQRNLEAARQATNIEPTEGQKTAGNYAKGTLPFAGMTIALENPKGSTRSGTNKDGSTWRRDMSHDYGYVKGTESKDGDQIDVYLAGAPDTGKVFVVNQVDPKNGVFDEHKAVLGAHTKDEAQKIYLSHYPKGWKGMGSLVEVSTDDFRQWINSGDTHRPVRPTQRVVRAFGGEGDLYTAQAPTPGAQESDLTFDHPLELRHGFSDVAVKRLEGAGIDRGILPRQGKGVATVLEGAHRQKLLAAMKQAGYDGAVYLKDGWEHYVTTGAKVEPIERKERTRSPVEPGTQAKVGAPVAIGNRGVLPANPKGIRYSRRSTPIAQWELNTLAREIKNTYKLQALELTSQSNGDIRLDRLELPHGATTKGIEEKVMQRLKEYAEARHSAIIKAPPPKIISLEEQQAEFHFDPLKKGSVEVLAPTNNPEPARQALKTLVKTRLVQTGAFKSGIKKVRKWEDAAHLFAPLRKEAQESLMALGLDAKGNVLGMLRSSIGDTSSSLFSAWTIAGSVAQLPGISSVYLGHNHPSGNSLQSTADFGVDRLFTELMRDSGVEYHGSIVVSPGDQNATFTAAGSMGDTSGKVTPGVRSKNVPVFGRRIVRAFQSGEGSPARDEDVRRLIAAQPEKNGIFMMDAQSRIVGVLPMTRKEMGRLRTQDLNSGTLKVLRGFAEANTPLGVVFSEDKGAMNNAVYMLRWAGIRVPGSYVVGPHGAEISTPADDLKYLKPFYTRGREGDTAVKRQAVTRAVRRVIAEHGFSKLPQIFVVDRISELPPDLLHHIQESGGEHTTGAVFWPGYFGDSIFMVAQNTADEQEAIANFYHELVGHYGLRQVLDEELYKEVTDGLWRSARDRVLAAAERNGLDVNDEDERRAAAEEVIAYAAGAHLGGEPLDPNVRRWWQKVLDYFRDLWKRLSGQVTSRDIDNMIANIIQQSKKALQTGEMVRQLNLASARSQRAETFYSAAERAIMNSKQGRASAQQWLNTIRKTPGVKPEELQWLGLEKWLRLHPGQIDQQELIDYIRANTLEVRDVLKGEGATNEDDQAVIRHAENLRARGVRVNFDEDGAFEGIEWTDPQTNVETTWQRTDSVDDVPHQYQDDVLSILDHAQGRATWDDGEDTARYQKYTLPGGKDYHELLLTLPSVPGNVASYRSSHFEDPNIVAHVRFNERTDSEGKRVLFLEEVQSDWHQMGRKSGYQDKQAAEDAEFLSLRAKNLRPAAAAAMRASGNFGFDSTNDALNQVLYHSDWQDRWKANSPNDAEIIGEWASASRAAIRANKSLNQLAPDAPFKTTWPELAMKRMIRWAAENGFDRIAWTTGQQQAERYNLQNHVAKILFHDNNKDGSAPRNGPFDGAFLSAITPEGKKAFYKSVDTREEIEGLIGKELTERLLNAPTTQTQDIGSYRERKLEGLDLQVGGEGMKGFYDEILPRTVGKLIKRWGGEVGATQFESDIAFEDWLTRIYGSDWRSQLGKDELPELREKWRAGGKSAGTDFIAHSFDITPEMRSAALHTGFPLYARRKQAEETVNAYSHRAQKLIDFWNDKAGWRFGALGKLPLQQQYLERRYLALGEVQRGKDIGHSVYQALRRADPGDQREVYGYLTTKDADPNSIKNPAIRAEAINAKKQIDLAGQALVDAGLLSQEVYDAHAGEYLPRLYLKHLLGKEGNRMLGSGKTLSDMGYLKKRKDIDEETRKVILGEITDPGFLASFGLTRTLRDVALVDFLESVSHEKAWVPPESLVEWNGRHVSPFFLRAEARSLRDRARYYEPENREKAEKMAQQMDEIAAQALQKLEVLNQDDHRQIPDSGRYGALRGMWVRKEIFEDLVGSQQMAPADPSSIEKLLGEGGILTRVNGYWKMSKVALNPPSQIRNFIGNAVLLHLSGVPMRRVYSGEIFVRAIDSIMKKDKYYEIAKKYGLFAVTFANNELARIRTEWLTLQAKNTGSFSMARVRAMAGKAMNAASDLYALNEAVSKIGKVIDAMERERKSEAQAMIEAHEWLFDYSLVPRAVRYLRNTPLGIPFLTFQYKVLPKLAQVAIKHPWRYLPYVALAYGIAALFKSLWGVDDEDMKKLRKAMPQWMQESGEVAILPWRDSLGRWQAMNLGYMLPWGMYGDLAANIRDNKLSAIPNTLGILGGPLPDVVSSARTNIDSFTGKQIVNQQDPTQYQIQELGSYLWSMAAPPWLTEKGWLGKLYKAETGAVDPRTGDPLLTPTQANLGLVGMSMVPFDPEETRQKNLRFMQYEIVEIQKRMKSVLRDKNLTPEEFKARRELYMDLIHKKINAMREYKRDSAVPEKLKTPASADDEPIVGNFQQMQTELLGMPRRQVVASLRASGYPDTANLIASLPPMPDREAREYYQKEAARS